MSSLQHRPLGAPAGEGMRDKDPNNPILCPPGTRSTEQESSAMQSRVCHVVGFGLFLPVLVLALSACGGSSSSGDMLGMPGMSHGGQGTSGSSSPSSGAARTVTLTLSDFKITSSQTAFVSGTTYHFVVTNSSKSTTNHELMAMKPL